MQLQQGNGFETVIQSQIRADRTLHGPSEPATSKFLKPLEDY